MTYSFSALSPSYIWIYLPAFPISVVYLALIKLLNCQCIVIPCALAGLIANAANVLFHYIFIGKATYVLLSHFIHATMSYTVESRYTGPKSNGNPPIANAKPRSLQAISYKMRSRISIRGYVCRSVGPSVRWSVGRSVRHTQVEFLRNGLNSNKIASET